ncbi:hypothetical protein N7467_011879 [Penicillium canescens]|nr:hypothetical protein N7467_011879 [Penicillium canescens]
MPVTQINNVEAVAKLKDLATWLYESAEMKQEKNLIKCVDVDRYKKTLPLLKALGYDLPLKSSQGHGYHIYRTSGETEIIKRPDLKTLFFPLSVGSGNNSIASGEVQVAGETVAPGSFIHLDSTLTITAQLDCLIVYLPEGK